jgi:membrane-bound lytic murein transglycosylase D
LKEYNTWIKDGMVPDDKEYAVVIPKGDVADFHNLWLSPSKKVNQAVGSAKTPAKEIQLNGLRAIVAQSGETVTSIAKRTNTDVTDLIRWNDVSIDWPVQAGQTFYLQRKIKSSNQSTHTVKAGESLWAVSQTYGIRLKTLKRLNGNMNDNLKPGSVVYLADIPGDVKVELAGIIEIDPNSPFEWGISGKTEADYVIKPTETVPATTQTTVALKNNKPDEHIVVAGETLYSIATRYGLKTADLQRVNNLGNETTVKPGQTLKLAENKTVATALALHEVQATDTLYSIARQYGLSVKELMDLNNKKDFDLKPGQKLVVK